MWLFHSFCLQYHKNFIRHYIKIFSYKRLALVFKFRKWQQVSAKFLNNHLILWFNFKLKRYSTNSLNVYYKLFKVSFNLRRIPRLSLKIYFDWDFFKSISILFRVNNTEIWFQIRNFIKICLIKCCNWRIQLNKQCHNWRI